MRWMIRDVAIFLNGFVFASKYISFRRVAPRPKELDAKRKRSFALSVPPAIDRHENVANHAMKQLAQRAPSLLTRNQSRENNLPQRQTPLPDGRPFIMRLSDGSYAGLLFATVTDASELGALSVLLRRLCRRVFTCRRHNPLESQIGHHVPIVLIRVRRIE
jgi:hypothetical protein